MKIKTSELTGPALDWAVAKAAGVAVRVERDNLLYQIWRKGQRKSPYSMGYTPSTDWAQGGPIIEREFITIDQKERSICACIDAPEGHELNDIWANGPTPLIAAMRCYVASKMGEVVEIPKELT